MDGAGCIVSRDSNPTQTVISNNNLTMDDSLNNWNANIWLLGSVGMSVIGNRTYQDGAFALPHGGVDSVYHIRCIESGAGITLISSNTVDNSAARVGGAPTGIEVYQSAVDVEAIVSVLNNTVTGRSQDILGAGGPPWEIRVQVNGILGNPQYFVSGNTVYGLLNLPCVYPHPPGSLSTNPANTLEDNGATQVFANTLYDNLGAVLHWW
jgi:hypothetical protein